MTNPNLETVLTQNEITLPQDPTNTVILTLNGQDHFIPMDRLHITFESNEREVLDAVEPYAVELGESLQENDDYTYCVQKMVNSHNIFCFPKPEAGF